MNSPVVFESSYLTTVLIYGFFLFQHFHVGLRTQGEFSEPHQEVHRGASHQTQRRQAEQSYRGRNQERTAGENHWAG